MLDLVSHDLLAIGDREDLVADFDLVRVGVLQHVALQYAHPVNQLTQNHLSLLHLRGMAQNLQLVLVPQR